MIQLPICGLVVELNGLDDREHLEELVRTDAVKKFAGILLKDILPARTEAAMQALRDGKVDEARHEASYAKAIEDIATALKTGVGEALKE